MMECKGLEETRKLMKALLRKYPNQLALSFDCNYTQSYLSRLATGRRIASRTFCTWVKGTHPDLAARCRAVQRSKLMD
jgi:hypothetical protein